MGEIAALAVAAALCALVVKQNAQGVALALTLAAGALILGQVLGAASAVRALSPNICRISPVLSSTSASSSLARLDSWEGVRVFRKITVSASVR